MISRDFIISCYFNSEASEKFGNLPKKMVKKTLTDFGINDIDGSIKVKYSLITVLVTGK